MNNERINPSWAEIDKFHDPLTDGERTLASFLDKNLPEEWEIYVQPYLNGSRPDIVLLNPNVGIMVYEVKDWALETYKIKIKMGKNEALNHLNQVEYYKEKIIKLLIPDIGEKIDRNKDSFSIVQTGLYLHKIDRENCKKLFRDRRYPSIIGCDDLNVSNLERIVPYYNLSKSQFMTEKWANDIRFWLMPPFHSKEQTSPIKLSPSQKDYAKLEKKKNGKRIGHRRLRGIAGSGKTLVLAYKAALLAEKRQKVLVITFNITLWHYIRDMIKRVPVEFDSSYISFNHFHGFCKDMLIELGVPLPFIKDNQISEEEFAKEYLKELFLTLSTAIEEKGVDKKLQYDAILIDEGQDFEWAWYNLLDKFLAERDELHFVCDKMQNIYNRELTWVDNMGEYKGKVKFRGDWRELNTVYRMPKKIVDLANDFSEKFGIEQYIKLEQEYEQLTVYEKPPLLQWRNIKSEDWLSNIFESYEIIKSQQLNLREGHASDIVILLPTKDKGKKAVATFKEINIDVNHIFDYENHNKKRKYKGRNKKAFWMGDSRLKICTPHSFKGWEALHVILLIPENWFKDQNLDSLVYTAITRTKKNLIILNCNNRYWEFGEKYDVNVDDYNYEELNADEENDIDRWMETLPYPLASIYMANIISDNYEVKLKYLLHFFEALSEFIFTLLLSGLSSDKLFYEIEVSSCIEKQENFKSDWFEKPSFGVWNNLGSCLAKVVRNHLKDNYKKNQVLKMFGKPKIEFLARLTSLELIMMLKKVSNFRNVWEGHGPRVSEEEYQKRYYTLQNMLLDVKNIIKDSFENTLLILPVKSELNNGIYHYTVKQFKTTRPPFRPMNIETERPLDNSKLYLVTKNKRTPLEILPLIHVENEICYFFNGKEYETGKARYNSYYNEKESELLIPTEEIGSLFELTTSDNSVISHKSK